MYMCRYRHYRMTEMHAGVGGREECVYTYQAEIVGGRVVGSEVGKLL